MQNLPIHSILPTIIDTLEHANKLVLQAPPGAGKTTAVPLALLDTAWLRGRQIIMLEPRRLATRNAAARMAEQLGEKVGETVGYQIRSDRCVGKNTRIIVVTEGILTRMLQSDPALENAALIIFDEFHERNLHGDLALALSLQSQQLLREDLKIMVMSATLNTDAISELLDHAPVITSEGRAFAVKNLYLDIKKPHPTPQQLSTLIARQAADVVRKQSGSILIFLPGVKEIRNTAAKLQELLDDDTVIIAPLYGDMSKSAQDAAILPAQNGRRKIVLATNIAETSLTIEGITVVIDSGLQRIATFNHGTGMNALHTVTISQDAAAQRSGRAGRLSHGTCYRLWHEHRQLPQHTVPEILTSDLTPMMLELANWGIDAPDELAWLDRPPKAAVDHARELLRRLGALEGNTITTHGKAMLALGVHPRLAHMIIKGSELGHGETACFIAALLSEKEIFTSQVKSTADLSERVRALKEGHGGDQFDSVALKNVQRLASDFRQKHKVSVAAEPNSADMTGVLLGFAYPDRIGRCRGAHNPRYLLSGGKGARLDNDDTLFGEPFLVVADLDAAQTDARIYRAAAITQVQIETYFSDSIIRERLTRWNVEAERVEVREITRLGAMMLTQQPAKDIDDTDVTMALLSAIQEKGLQALSWSKEALGLRQRVDFLRFHHDKVRAFSDIGETLPDFSDRGLMAHLEHWLLPHLNGVKSFKACQQLNTFSILSGMLTWEQQQQINALAPAKIRVPSGSDIRIDYEDPVSPVLGVRLQELFGMLETPTLIHGSVIMTVELLSPAYRPMQVTKDLQSFWENTYQDVRKELRGKYKKHYWPDDPFTAQATSKTKKNM